MKSRYLILLSLIVAIGSVGCTGLLDDPGQITIDGAPGAALEDPDSEVQGIGSKELTFSCPTPDVERDMTELAKLLPKECGGKEGEIVLLADLSSMLENETIREFVIGMVQRSQTEDALKKIIDEDNLSQFPYGMSKYDRINYYNSKTEKEKEALQKRARESEMVNAMNDEMLSFILNLVGSQTDFAMCATIDDDATKDNSSNLGNTAPARGTAQSMGLGLRNLVMAKTAQGNAAAEETEPEEAAQRMNYTTSRYYDEENLNLMVIVTDDSNAAEAFAELQDKLRKRDEFKDLNLDSESPTRSGSQ